MTENVSPKWILEGAVIKILFREMPYIVDYAVNGIKNPIEDSEIKNIVLHLFEKGMEFYFIKEDEKHAYYLVLGKNNEYYLPLITYYCKDLNQVYLFPFLL